MVAKRTLRTGECIVKMSDTLACGRPIIDDESRCLMHSHLKEKDSQEFDREISRILSHASDFHRPPDKYDFLGFVFPTAHWTDLVFELEVILTDTHFSAGLFCSGTTFKGPVFAEHVEFTNAVVFDKTTFVSCSFTFSKFRQNLFFTKCSFNGLTWFSNIRCFKEASFYDVQFDYGASFTGARFTGATEFIRVNFGCESLIGGRIPPVADLSGVIFHSPEQTDFFQTNKGCLQKLRLRAKNTNLERVHLIDVDWHKDNTDRIVLQDELDIRKSRVGVPTTLQDYHLVARLYRQLINNMERTRSYGIAEDFFIGAMEMRRLNPQYFPFVRWKWMQGLYANTSWVRLIGESLTVTNTYRILSNYGSDYKRAAGIILLLVLFFGIGYALPASDLTFALSTAPINGHFRDWPVAWLERLTHGLIHTLEIATFQRAHTYLVGTQIGGMLHALQTVAIPGQLALLFLALRRRLRR